MIHKGTRLLVNDNSGGLICEAFGCYGRSRFTDLKVGDIMKVAIKKAEPNAKVKKGQIYKALITSTVYAQRCFDGGYAYAGANGCVLLTENLEAIGTVFSGKINRNAFNLASKTKELITFCSKGGLY